MISQRAFCSTRAVQRVMMTLTTLSWASWRAIKLLHFHFSASPYIHNHLFFRLCTQKRFHCVQRVETFFWSLQARHPMERPCRYYFTGARQLLHLKIASVLQTMRHPPLLQASFVEEEIDRMNESFLRLSVELQNRTRLSLQPGEGDGSVGNHSSAVISTKTASTINTNNSFFVLLSNANFHCCSRP